MSKIKDHRIKDTRKYRCYAWSAGKIFKLHVIEFGIFSASIWLPLNREEAQKLYNALGDWLGGKQ